MSDVRNKNSLARKYCQGPAHCLEGERVAGSSGVNRTELVFRATWKWVLTAKVAAVPSMVAKILAPPKPFAETAILWSHAAAEVKTVREDEGLHDSTLSIRAR